MDIWHLLSTILARAENIYLADVLLSLIFVPWSLEIHQTDIRGLIPSNAI